MEPSLRCSENFEMIALEHLRSTQPPWVELLVLKNGQTYEKLYDQPWGFVVKTINGKMCKSEKQLFSEFARIFEFPSYFGRNWDALDECITDLEWMPAHGYLILINNADEVLANAEGKYDVLLRVLKRAGEEWATPQAGQWRRPAIPFHVLLIVTEEKKAKRSKWNLPETTIEGPEKGSKGSKGSSN
jgi:RNAse (barnase) inhibitor barstar